MIFMPKIVYEYMKCALSPSKSDNVIDVYREKPPNGKILFCCLGGMCPARTHGINRLFLKRLVRQVRHRRPRIKGLFPPPTACAAIEGSFYRQDLRRHRFTHLTSLPPKRRLNDTSCPKAVVKLTCNRHAIVASFPILDYSSSYASPSVPILTSRSRSSHITRKSIPLPSQLFRDMEPDAPCKACSWTSERQHSCRYESHVKLFYSVSDRGAWSLGSKYILKERSTHPPTFEVRNIRFLRKQTTIPVPRVALEFNDNDRHFMVTERIPGNVLDTIWTTLLPAEKEKIAKQTVDYLFQLRQLRSSRMQSLDEQPLYSAFLFLDGFGVPHGPLCSDDELWADLVTVLSKLPEKVHLQLRGRMPPAEPYTFTHGDLNIGNIVVQDGNLAGILDWESSGYFPVWWEFTCAGIGLGEDDQEWKLLLRKNMPPHESAREFWMDVYALRNYPDLDERGKKVFARLNATT
ncbi:kinase-like protein [Amniculicola lignicola CBS 123094]|uniref:Kinase-like protein n=1 Tax=Amniculicola lignicola CBS 123094 TaxID=1392246 RepID=A0A6A5W2Q7_9PLEO|nr:kinase-like protein [Amniculicola lignicola CBS 123094]